MTRKRSWCKNCGESVLWFEKIEGGFFRPLEFAGQFYIPSLEDKITDNPIATFKLHYCDPKKVEAFKKTAEADHRRREEYEYQLAAAQIDGLKKPCPKCGAKVGQACVNLSARKLGKIKKTVWPHPERLNGGDSENNSG